MIQMDKKTKKRPSLSKIDKEKPMNMTVTGGMFSHTEIKQPKLPPLRTDPRKTITKLPKPKEQSKQRIETQTTFIQSSMFQSYYQTMSKGWVKPSDYIKEISELNLMGEKGDDVGEYEIKLSQNVQKNMLKLQSLLGLTEKWVGILRKVMFYTVSKKTSSQKLIEQIKFWKVLSKKFDQLEYQFSDKKTMKLVALMKTYLKTKPQMKKTLQQFISLKDQVIMTTPLVQKLYWSLEESLAGNIQKFEESSDIVMSIDLLKKILLGLKMIEDGNPLIRGRIDIIYDKVNSCLIEKLLAAPLYPRQLANISGLKQKYRLIDTALSFYSNFLAIMQEEEENENLIDTIENAENTRNVIVNLLQILGYFEFLYNKKEVSEFSKLFSYPLEFNIYDKHNSDEWNEYMEKVEKSMEIKGFEP